ncbi:MAG: TlyA family RNA methyltransferase [Desulfobacterales bacterium]
MTGKKRLDTAMAERALAQSRQRAHALIMAGKVLVNQQPMDKPGSLVSPEDEITVRGEDMPYVSRGGLKLERALEYFAIDASGLVCLDVGASTGGFTDCLLQHGAEKVFAVDVGYGQLAWKLRQDPRVVVIERTNIRHMHADRIPQPVDLVTIDASFISLRIVVPAILKFMADSAGIIALIKPQFEVGKGRVGKGGVVRDPELHREVNEQICDFFFQIGLVSQGIIPSPILGPKGNKEFVTYLLPNRSQGGI